MCLERLGRLLAGHVRPDDLAARTGGEEFTVVLVGATLEDAVSRAERIRQSVGTESERSWGRRVTVSVGVAQRPENADASATDLIAVADRALYRAKAEGRNTMRLGLVAAGATRA